MTRKINVKGILKNSAFGFMEGVMTGLSSACVIIGTNLTVAWAKDKSIPKSDTVVMGLVTALFAYQAARNVQNQIRYINGDIADYPLYIYEDEDEPEEI